MISDREKFMISYLWILSSFPEYTQKQRIGLLQTFSKYLCPTISDEEGLDILLEIYEVLGEIDQINASFANTTY